MSRPTTTRPVLPAGTPSSPARPAPRVPEAGPPPGSRRTDRRSIRAAVRARRAALQAERRRSGPSGRRRRLLVAAAIALVLGVLLGPALLSMTPAFAVRSIAVSGATGADAQAVAAALQGQLGRPVALVADQDVAAALRSTPIVESFTVVRRPPSTLEVRVALRTPVAQSQSADGWRLLDAAGVTVRTASGRFDDVPVVALASGAPSGAFGAAVSAIGALRDVDSIRIDRVTASTPDDVVVQLSGGPRVVWGGAEDGAGKAEALRAALVRAADRASTIDVSSPGVVLTR